MITKFSGEERDYESVLSSLNSEVKASFLLLLGSEWKRTVELEKEVLSILGEEPNFSVKSLFKSSSKLFSKFGFVERKVGTEELRPAEYWILTEKGENLLKPIAAKAIDTITELNVSLYKIMGRATLGGRKSSTLNSIKILIHLHERGRSSLEDLAREVESSSTNIYSHLTRMAEASVLELERGEKIKGKKFRWSGFKSKENIVPRKGLPTLTKKVVEFLSENRSKYFSPTQIARKIDAPVYPVCGVLKFLERQEAVVSSGRKGQTYYLELSDKGKEFVERFIEPTMRFLDPNTDKEEKRNYRETLENFLEDEELMRSKIKKALRIYENSRSPRRSIKETREKIYRLLREEELGASQIEERLNLRPRSFYFYAGPLIKERLIRKKKIGNRVLYSALS